MARNRNRNTPSQTASSSAPVADTTPTQESPMETQDQTADAAAPVTEQPQTDTAPVAETPAAPEAAQPTPDATVTETPAAPAAPVAPVQPPVPAPAAETAAPDNIQTYFARTYPGQKELPIHVLATVEKLDTYVRTMGLNVPVTDKDGTQQQLALLRTFASALSAPNGQFIQCLQAIVWYFSNYRTGAFSERLACRFLNADHFNKERQDQFISLVNLFQTMADPTKRRQLNKYVNMDVVIRRIPSVEHQRNLMTFVQKR